MTVRCAEGSTISWIPCGRKLTCSFPGIKCESPPPPPFTGCGRRCPRKGCKVQGQRTRCNTFTCSTGFIEHKRVQPGLQNIIKYATGSTQHKCVQLGSKTP